jgi:hypothetical protein
LLSFSLKQMLLDFTYHHWRDAMPYEPVNVEGLKDDEPRNLRDCLLGLNDINLFLDNFTQNEGPRLFQKVPIRATTGRQP